MTSHQGPVLHASKTKAIFWGPQWLASSFAGDKISGLDAFFTGFGSSSYAATASEYYDAAGYVTSQSTYLGHVIDSSKAPSKALTVSSATAEVCKITSNRPDPSALYLIYTATGAGNVNYCAWHTWGKCAGGALVQVAYMPNTAGTTSCYPTSGYFASVTNYSYGTRSIADNTAHEFMEAVTDPVPPTGWVDANGAEIGDKCNFNYLAPVTLSVGSLTTIWQIQSEWSNAVNGCAETTP